MPVEMTLAETLHAHETWYQDQYLPHYWHNRWTSSYFKVLRHKLARRDVRNGHDFASGYAHKAHAVRTCERQGKSNIEMYVADYGADGQETEREITVKVQ